MISVRFAPSPTGYMHIGNLRTALLNRLFADNLRFKTGEEVSYVLRMDDTDLERSKPEYEQAVYEDLKWMGISWDRLEHQSERLDRYRSVVEELKAKGRIYACYETAEELEYKRRRQRARGLPPVYDRAGMRLTAEERRAYEAEGRRPHYRFVLEHKETSWDDMVRGSCAYNGEHLSDPVVVREDGTFPYMLPSVIDDMDFGITHIIRGEDHVTNTAVQIQMFEVLGGRIPVFGHPPLLTGREGKLSKRLGSLSSRELREEGIEPMTIACLLARLGTPDPVVVCRDLDELAKVFDLSHFGRAQPHFDPDELFKLNPRILHEMSLEDVNARLKDEGKSPVSADFWKAVAPNVAKVGDIADWADVCSAGRVFDVPAADRDFCRTAAALLPEGSVGEETFAAWTSALKAQTGRKGKDLFRPLRLALTGREQGPELKMLLPVLGREEILRRLQG